MSRTENRVFFPQEALDQWMGDAKVDLRDNELTIMGAGGGRRFLLAEAVRVLREVSDTANPHELVGRVKARTHLDHLGAEIVQSSMLVGDAAYDVEPGWIGIPVGSFAEHLASQRLALDGRAEGDRDNPTTDEELLARFLAQNL